MLALALAGAMLGMAAAPVPKLTPEQAELMKQRDALRAQAARLFKQKKKEAWKAALEADALLEKADGPMTLGGAGRQAAVARSPDAGERWK
ncbi:MAG: hypothetical protein K2W96_19085, partial [Gemmataceae bacterium]|nr:hypothetical protein [Gemmataceae bacterium]